MSSPKLFIEETARKNYTLWYNNTKMVEKYSISVFEEGVLKADYIKAIIN